MGRSPSRLFKRSAYDTTLTSELKTMEVVELSNSSTMVPRNLRCLLQGASESGKSSFILKLLKNKESMFPVEYAKFIYCSPHLGSNGFSSSRDLEYRKLLEEYCAPTEILFFNYILTEEELLQISEEVEGPVHQFGSSCPTKFHPNRLHGSCQPHESCTHGYDG